jgi:predicted dehydrogenase
MKVAVVGLGWWGKEIIRRLSTSPRFQIVCGADPFPQPGTEEFLQSHGMSFTKDLDDVVRAPDVEGVILATPHALHEEQALRILAGRKHLFCEKPLTLTVAGAEKIVAAAQDFGSVVGVGHERRFEPAFEELQRIVDAGEIGRLLRLEANISHDRFRHVDHSNWRLSGTHAPAGMMTAVGIHQTDLFVRLAGPIEEVRATAASIVFEPPAEDFVHVDIVFKSQARASITSLSATPFYSRVTVFGDKGWVEIVSEANVDVDLPTIMTRSDGNSRTVTSFDPAETVRKNFEAWVDGVEGRKPYRFTSDQLVENVRILESVVKSVRANGAAIVP